MKISFQAKGIEYQKYIPLANEKSKATKNNIGREFQWEGSIKSAANVLSNRKRRSKKSVEPVHRSGKPVC